MDAMSPDFDRRGLSGMGERSTQHAATHCAYGNKGLACGILSGKVARPAVSLAFQQQRGLRILLVEDNLVNQMIGSKPLARLGHKVVIAANGMHALTEIGRDTFDLIFMDVQMPEMDGLEATREIRKSEAVTGTRVPIVAMTAHSMTGDRERFLASGMDGYISKPVTLSGIAEQIRLHVDGR